MKKFFNKIALKFANTFYGPRLTVLLTVLGIFIFIGIMILVTL